MTQPDKPDSGDDIIKVIYQAVADYSHLLRETRRAQTETAALKREIEGLAGNTQHTVRVTADTGQARTELGRVLRDVVVTVKVALDAAAAKTELAALGRNITTTVRVHADTNKARADVVTGLAGITAKVGVELDRAGVLTKMRALITYLQNMGPVRLKVDIDSSAFARLRHLADELKSIREDINNGGGGNNGPPTPGPTPGPGPRPRPRPGGGDNDALPEGLSSAARMILLVVSLAATAIPIAAALTAGVGAIAAAMVAAGAAAGIFAVAAVGAFARAKAAAEDYQKTGRLADGPVGEVVARLETLKARYAEFQQATQGPVLDVFAKGLDLAISLLGRIEPLVDTMSGAVSRAMDIVAASFDSDNFSSFLDFVARTGPDAISGFTTGLTGFAEGIGQLIMAFEPLISGFVDGFADAGTAFAQWASELDNNRSFQDFLQYAIDNVPTVIDFIKNLIAAASNIITAIAPIGSMFLAAANAALAFVAAIPTGTLTGVITTVLALAAAFKLLSLAMAISSGISNVRGLTTALGGLGGGLGRSVTGTSALASGLARLGAMAAIAVAAQFLTYSLQKLADQQANAAEATKRHADAAKDLGQQLASGKSLSDSEVRAGQYEKLTGINAEGAAGGILGLGETKATANLGTVAKAAGIGADELVTGSLGADPRQQARNIGRLEDYRRKVLAEAEKNDDTEGKAKAEAIGKLIDQYEAQSMAVGEAANAAEDYKKATGDADTATRSATDAAAEAEAAYLKQAKAAGTAAEQLAFLTNTPAPQVTAYNAAVTAMDAYTQGVKDHRDAQAAATRAEQDARTATDNLARARADATQRIIDLRRSLRDMSVDERQANLSAKTADDRLNKLIQNGGSADEIEQATLDAERARNARNDFNQDKGRKRKDINKEIDKGVEGSDGVKAAKRQQADAEKALETARTNLSTAATKLTELHAAFANAASALGLSEGAVKTLKANMDGLKDKTVKVNVNTKTAEERIANLLRGQYAITLLAQNPTWTYEQAWAAAAAVVAGTDKKAADTKPKGADPGGFYHGHATGGPTVGAVHGPGHGTSDSIPTVLPVGGPVRLSRGEHIVTDAEVQAGGGHGYVEAFRAALRAGKRWGPMIGYAGGGPARSPVPANWNRPARPVTLPAWGMPSHPSLASVPGYSAGGAVAAMAAGGGTTYVDRSVTVHANIHNPTPEPASTSMYRVVRDAVDGEPR